MGRHDNRTRRLMLTLLGGLAEFEPDAIRARTGEGRERAKASGQSLGRKPKLTSCRQREPIQRRDRGEPFGQHRPQLQHQPEHDFRARSLDFVSVPAKQSRGRPQKREQHMGRPSKLTEAQKAEARAGAAEQRTAVAL
jgi:hypothetical protein